MIWIFLILSQLHVIYSFPAETVKYEDIVSPLFPNLLNEPGVDSPNLKKGNEKTHHHDVIIDHVNSNQRPPTGQATMPPTEVEIFDPSKPVPPPSFLPVRPGQYHSDFPLSSDVEVFNPAGSMFPNILSPPDVEIFDPSDVRPISSPIIVADIEMLPLEENAIKRQAEMDGPEVDLSTLDIPEEPQTSFSSNPSWNATKVYENYKQLAKFLDSEISVDVAPTNSSFLKESENISTTERSEKSDITSKDDPDFVVRIYHKPPKMCYRRLSKDNKEGPERCISFYSNYINSKNTVDTKNVNHSSEILDQSTNSTFLKKNNEYGVAQPLPLRNVTSKEVYDEEDDQSTPPQKDIKFGKVAENSLDDVKAKVKELIDQLLMAESMSPKVVAGDERASATEFPESQETTTETILLAKKSAEDTSKDLSVESDYVREFYDMQQDGTSLPLGELTSSEVYGKDEDGQSTPLQNLKDIKFGKVTENSLDDDHAKVKELIDQLLMAESMSPRKAIDDETASSTEFPESQETITETILLAKKREDTTEDSSVWPDDDVEFDDMQQDGTSDQISNPNLKILKNNPELQELSRLLFEYFVNRKQISASSPNVSKEMQQNSTSDQKLITDAQKLDNSTSTYERTFLELFRLLAENVKNSTQTKPTSSNNVKDEGFANYVMSPILPYEEPLVAGRSANNLDDLISLLDLDNFAPSEGNISSKTRSALPNGAGNEADSQMYLVPQQPESMRADESYFSLPEERIVPLEYNGYI